MKAKLLILLISLLWALPGQARGVEASSTVEKTALLSLCYHDVTPNKNPKDTSSITVNELVKQLTWLQGNGYEPISLSQWNKAKTPADLPEKPVLLTFDDGYASFLEHVLPLLELFDFPAVLAPVTSWIDAPEGQPVPYGNEFKPRDHFLTWDDLREISSNELIELASHTHDLHNAQLSNPFGNELPAASVHIYDPQTNTYESDSAYLKRLERDLQTSQALFESHLGKAPDTIVWPYGSYNHYANAVAAKLGMKTVLTLNDTPNIIGHQVVHRELISTHTTLADLATIAQQIQDSTPIRSIYIEMDQLYEPDPIRFAKKFDALLDQIKALGIGTVFVQAFSDVDKDGLAEAVYFPNRHLPMRADLFNRVSWQLRTRADVVVYAWMPQHAMADVSSEGSNASNTAQPTTKSRVIIRDIYEDLGKSSLFHGVLLDEKVHFSPPKPNHPHFRFADYRVTETDAANTVVTNRQLETPYLVSSQLTQILRNWQPALVAINDGGPLEHWQSKDQYLKSIVQSLPNYSYITVSVSSHTQDDLNSQGTRLIELADSLRSSNPGAFHKIIFQVHTKATESGSLISVGVLKDQLDKLLTAGISNIAYDPVELINDSIRMEVARSQLSINSFPALKE